MMSVSSFTTPLESNLVDFIINRVDSWRTVLQSLVEFYKGALISIFIQIDMAYAEQLTVDLLSKSAPSLPGPLHAFASQSVAATNSQTLYSLSALLNDDYSKAINEIRDRLARLQKAVNKEQDVLTKVLGDHQKIWAGSIDGDPWLSELLLQSAVEAFLKEKSAFCRGLQEVYALVEQKERQLHLEIFRLIKEYLVLKTKQTLLIAEHADGAITSISSADPMGSWSAALAIHKLDYDWVLASPPADGFSQSLLAHISIDSQRQVRSIAIVKSGLLMRNAGAFRSWTVCFAILTDSRYLHLYDPPKEQQLKYRFPKPSHKPHRRALLELNANISAFWLGSEKTNLCCDPVVSIPLAGSTLLPDSPTEYIFSTTVPGATGFFARGERKYSLRCFLEEDMVDWVIAIKEQIKGQESAPVSPIKILDTNIAPERDETPFGVTISNHSLMQMAPTGPAAANLSDESQSINLENPWET